MFLNVLTCIFLIDFMHSKSNNNKSVHFFLKENLTDFTIWFLPDMGIPVRLHVRIVELI